MRDQRPWAGTAPPGAVYRFAPDGKEEHVRDHLSQTGGILQGEEGQQTIQWIVSPTNPAERTLRPTGIGWKNWIFAGADTGAETLARAMTIIQTAKMNGLDPQACLADVLDRIHDHKINRLDEILPWQWAPAAPSCAEAA